MKIFITSLFVAVILASTSIAYSQNNKALVPIDKYGLGVKVGVAGNNGINLAYALKNNMHLGTGLGIGIQTDNNDERVDNSGVSFAFSPFFRYIFTNKANLFPFLELNFSFTQFPTGGTTNSKSSINVQAGGLWFPFPSVSLRGGVNSISYSIDKEQLGIGVLTPFLGIDWWM
ncbi:MAG: hypothetical protein ACE364_10160 [Chlorobiota bacterium]